METFQAHVHQNVSCFLGNYCKHRTAHTKHSRTFKSVPKKQNKRLMNGSETFENFGRNVSQITFLNAFKTFDTQTFPTDGIFRTLRTLNVLKMFSERFLNGF